MDLFLNQTPLILLLCIRQTWKIRLTQEISWWGSLCEGGTCFCVRLTLRKFWVFLFMFSTGFILFGFLFLFHQSISVLMFVLSSCCLVLQAFSWVGNCDQVFWLSFYWLSLRFKRAALFFVVQMVIILLLIDAIFVIIKEMFHGRMSVKLILLLLLLLLVNFVSGSRMKLIHISLIINIRSRISNLYGFQLLVLLL